MPTSKIVAATAASTIDRGRRSRSPRPARCGLVARWLRNDHFRKRDQGRLLNVGQALAQQVGDFVGRLEPRGRVLGVQPGDDRGQPVGNVRVDLANRPRLVSEMRRRMPKVVSARNGGRPVHSGVEHAAQAEQVAAGVDRLAAGLLRRHVLRRAGDHAGLRQAGVVDRPGQAEVGDLQPLDARLPAGCWPA